MHRHVPVCESRTALTGNGLRMQCMRFWQVCIPATLGSIDSHCWQTALAMADLLESLLQHMYWYVQVRVVHQAQLLQ